MLTDNKSYDLQGGGYITASRKNGYIAASMRWQKNYRKDIHCLKPCLCFRLS